jgi:hypothetical protein
MGTAAVSATLTRCSAGRSCSRNGPGDVDAAYVYLMDQKGVRSRVAVGGASEGDAGAAKGIKEVVEASKNLYSTIKIYPGTEHGVRMFAKNSDLEPMIVSWLQEQLSARHGTR